MKTILTYLVRHCLYLFDDYGFRFADSTCSKSFGGDASVTIKSPKLLFRFTYDRGQLLLEIASTKIRRSAWYSIDLISQLVTGNVESSALLDKRYARFLHDNIESICKLFSDKQLDATVHALNKMAKERAKRLFG
jgi:hypothetical protein